VRLDQGFLDDIAAHPEDDAPRLIYADWLEDNGQGHRAEFIRLQCRLATLDEHDPERLLLEERQADLLLVCEQEWRGSLPTSIRKEPVSFRRGFVEQVSLTATTFLRKGEELFTQVPFREVQLRAVPGTVPILASSPLLARLSALDLSEKLLSGEQWRMLATSPYLDGLAALTVWLGPEGVRELATWPHLPRLRRLDLPGWMATADPITALASAPLRALTHLRLGNATVHGENLRTLAEGAPDLANLALWSCNVTPDVGPVLEREENLPALTSLTLHGPRVAVEAVEALCRSQVGSRLESLDLACIPDGNVALRGLTQGERPCRLRRLNLCRTEVSAAGAQALARAVLPELRWLDLGDNRIDASALGRLVASPHLVGLRWLNLGNNPLGDDGARALAGSPNLRGLTWLCLSHCGIGDEGAKALAASANLAGLRHLDLGQNESIGPAGVTALAAAPYLGELRLLSLANAQFDISGVRALARSPQLAQLRRLDLRYSLGRDDPVLDEFRDPACLPHLLTLGVGYTEPSPGPLVERGRVVSL
jgi:uncharacterized protein (TIGR02996 family)